MREWWNDYRNTTMAGLAFTAVYLTITTVEVAVTWAMHRA